MKKLRYAGYVRVSDERQTQGYSLAVQREAIEKHVKDAGGVLVEIYEDAGISGTSTRGRDEFARMRIDARRKLFDVLVVHKFDRLARNRLDARTTKTMMRKDLGIQILSASGELSEDTDPIVGALIEGVMETLAEWYSLNLSQEVKKTRRKMIEEGKWYGGAPYGYITGEDGILIPHPEQAKVIRWIFETYSRGKIGMRALAKKLEDDGVPAPTEKGWKRITVRFILKSRTYLGELRHQSYRKDSQGRRKKTPIEWFPGKHEALISEELFDRCQEVMLKNDHNVKMNGDGSSRYMLNGLVICGDCQQLGDFYNNRYKMFTRSRKAKLFEGEYYYYCCPHLPSHGNVRADSIEGELVDFLLSNPIITDLDDSEKTIAAIAADIDTQNIQKRIKELEGIIKRVD